ncbi:hypothetical protein OIO90_003116 [Microbotryomycetes sp. JL221]|nr:hypothetical protein OIO90_003116 [Microbotryomycetes sp. JL221]
MAGDNIAPNSPSTKVVSFAESPKPSPPPDANGDAEQAGSSSATTTPQDASTRPTIKRRRSSLKQGSQMPPLPAREYYSHSDPLLRRLRLRDAHGDRVNLQKQFQDAKVVFFLFGWDDGSSSISPATKSDSERPEPFLLAGDSDLEEDTSHSDESGTLYLRPYSRVFLAEKYTVLGVPSLMVYHVGKKQMLTTHARFELLREEKADATWEQWEKGERITFSVKDLMWSLRWTLSAGAVAGAYLVAVRYGGATDVVQSMSAQLTKNFLGLGR